MKTKKKNFISRFFYFKFNKAIFFSIVGLFLIGLGAVYAFAYHDLYQIYENYTIRKNSNTDMVQPNEKIRIKFNIPINEQKVQQSFTIIPQIKGNITWEKNYLFGYAKVFVFSPETYFDENQNYTIKIGDIESMFGTNIHDRTYSFSTVRPFKVSSITPQDNQKDIGVNPEIKVVFDGVGDFFNIDFKLDPVTKLKIDDKVEENNQTMYILKPETQLGQGIKYTLTIKQTYVPNKKVVNTQTFHFETQPPVEISKVLPDTDDSNIHVKRKVIIAFNKPVDQKQAESNFSITPNVEGSISWKDNSLIFTPNDQLTKNTKYSINIKGGIKGTQDNSFLEGDKQYTFTTKDSDLYPAPPTNGPKYATGKLIQVDLASQTLYTYEDGELINSFLISSGVAGHPSPVGEFKIYSKAVSVRMTGFYGAGSPDNYDLPGVPFVSAFDGPYTIHGTYWHHNFGTPMSHGCINMYTPDSEWVYYWAPIGSTVIIE